MPDRLMFVTAVSGGGFDQPMEAVDIRVIGTGANASVRVSNYGWNEAYVLQPSGNGNFSSDTGSSLNGAARVSIDLPGRPGASIEQVAIDDAFAIWDAGGRGNIDIQLSASGFFGDRAALVAARVGSTDMVYVARSSGEGLAAYELESNGDLRRVDVETNIENNYLGGVSSLAIADMGDGDRFLFAGSATEDGITVMEIAGNGTLSQIGHLGGLQKFPIQIVTALEVVTIGSSTFLIAAGAGTSSLSVLEVSSNGTITTVDHVLDGRDTRFGGVTEMAVLEADGMVYVAVAGSDHGLTLLTLGEDGLLTHLDTIEDSTSTALAGVSDIAMVETSRGLEIITAAGGEAGVNHFRVDIDVFAQSAQSGDDIIRDTNGSDTLSGGAGSDLFIMLEDGDFDEIHGLVVGEDLIDLTGWSQFYSVSQLDISNRNWGARVTFGDETLDLRSDDGDPFGFEDIQSLIVQGVSRVAVDESSTMAFPDRIAEGSSSRDIMRGSMDSDRVYGESGNDQVFGLAGDDTLYGGSGNDTLHGGVGDDALRDHSGRDVFIGGVGEDTVSYASHRGGVTVNLETGENSSGDTFSGIEHLQGSATAADKLTGDGFNNILRGFGGNDTLDGGRGNDRLEGGAGNDRLRDDSGADTFIGGSGSDTVSYYGRVNGVFVNLETGANNSGDTYSNIENLHGSDRGADTLIGDSGNNRLQGGGGNDRLDGGLGNDRLEGGNGRDFLSDHEGNDRFIGGSGADTVSYFSSASGVSANLSTGVNNSGDTYSSIESLYGSNGGADTLTGNDRDNRLYGYDGNDRLNGGRGDDTLDGRDGDDYMIDISGRDHFEGGAGRDTVSYYGRQDGIFVNLRTGDNNSGDRFISIEALNGSNTGEDTLVGNDRDNRLRGFGGDDTLNGGRGDDTLEGGAGNDYMRDESGRDTFIGGSGRDMVAYTGRSSGIEVNLATGENNSGDTYSSIEDVRGSNRAGDVLIGSDGGNRLQGLGGHDEIWGGKGNDTLDGGAGNDLLVDSSGSDRFIGGSGQDTVSYFERISGIVANLETGSNNSGDRYSSIEHLYGSINGADRLTGTSGDNTLRGIGGNDTLDGSRGNDTLIGGSGDDYFTDVSGADRFFGGSGQDTVSYFGRDADTYVHLGTGRNNSGDTYSSIESVNGSNTGHDTLIGDEGDNRLRGFGGNDTLFGGHGNDRLEGGDGNDYLRDYSGANTFIGGSGSDMVGYSGRTNGVYVNLATGANNVEDRYFGIEDVRGSDGGNDRIFGNSGNNRLEGQAGDDTIFGRGGNDTLVGGAGDDYLRDENGLDLFIGGAGQDTVSYFGREGGVRVNLETGSNNSGDRYFSIEHLEGSNEGGDRLTGNSGNNLITGLAGNDRIDGGRGNDTLSGGSGNDRLSDASGADTFIGGSGQDTVSYYNHESGVNVSLATGENSSGDVYISIEHLFGSATRGDNLRGDSGDNKISGFGGWDTVNGGSGADTIDGGWGNDRLTGGSGADEFVFEINNGNDRITDFEIGIDVIAFDIAGLDFADLSISDGTSGARVSYDQGDVITLSGVDAADLSSSDFDFS